MARQSRLFHKPSQAVLCPSITGTTPVASPPPSVMAPMTATPSRLGRMLALAAAVLGWMFDGLEMGLFPLVGRPALAEMLGGADIGPWFGRIIAVFLVGAAFGGFALGWLGDRIGRTRAMVWSVLAYSVFSGLGAI